MISDVQKLLFIKEIMNKKIHFIIIGIMVVGMFTAWQRMLHSPTSSTEIAQPKNSDWFIRVVRASYGLNCLKEQSKGGQNIQLSADESKKTIQENNVITVISQACNGQNTCNIAVSGNILPQDPMPACAPKILEVEYRCFSYDKLWDVQAKTNSLLKIDCTEKSN